MIVIAEKSYSVRLMANVGQYLTAMGSAQKATGMFGKTVNTQMVGAGRTMQSVGKNLTRYMTLPLAGAGIAASKFAVDWESSFAGVQKTVDGTATQMSALEGGLRDMAKELPATHEEIAGVAEAAGQLGVGVEDVEDFTRVMVDLGETTNLSAEQAATSLARFGNIMGTTGADVERVGSTIVELGNNSATTEAEIVELGTRLAAAGKIAGLSESDVLAFASTLTSVGVEAQAGGTALSKVFTSISDATKTGGDDLRTFAEVAGSSAQEFTTAFQEDPANAVASFIDGLGRMNAAGESTSQVFDDLGLADQRLMRALLSTSEAQGMLTEQIEMGRGAWEDNTALADEAAVRYETMASKLQVVWNQIKDALIDVGDAAMPLVMGIVEQVGTLATAFGDLPDGVKTGTVAVGAFAAALPLLLRAGGGIVSMLGRMGVGFDDVGAASRTATKWITGIGVAVAGAVSVYQRLNEHSRRVADEKSRMIDLLRQEAEGHENAANEALLAEMDEHLSVLNALGIKRQEAVDFIRGEEVPALAELQGTYDDSRDGADGFLGKLGEMKDGLIGGSGELDDYDNKVHELADSIGVEEEALRSAVEAIFVKRDAHGGATTAIAEGNRLTKSHAAVLDEEKQAMRDAWTHADGHGEAVEGMSDKQDDAAKSAEELARALESAWTGVDDALAGALQEIAGDFESAERKASSFNQALDALFQPEIDYEQWLTDVALGIKTLGDDIDEETQSMDRSTEATIKNRQGFESRLQTIKDGIPGMRELGMSTGEMSKQLEGMTLQLIASGREAGLTDEQMFALIETYGLTPEQVQTTIEAAELFDVQQRVEDLKGQYENMPPEIVTLIETLIDEGKIGKARQLLTALEDGPWEPVYEALTELVGAETALEILENGPWEPVFTGIPDMYTVDAATNETARDRDVSFFSEVVGWNAEGDLNGIGEDRTASFFSRVADWSAESDLDGMAHDRTVNFFTNVIGGFPRAKGGTVQPGETTLVGEQGPELARFPAGTEIIPADRTAAMLREARSFTSAHALGFGGGSTTNVSNGHTITNTNNVVGMTRDEIQRAVERGVDDALWKAGAT